MLNITLHEHYKLPIHFSIYKFVRGILKKPSVLLSVWLSSSVIYPHPCHKNEASQSVAYSFSPFSNKCQWNPACNWHKIPTEAQRILFHLNPRYDTSPLVNVYGAGAMVVYYFWLANIAQQGVHASFGLQRVHHQLPGLCLLWLAMGISSASYSQSWPGRSQRLEANTKQQSFHFQWAIT